MLESASQPEKALAANTPIIGIQAAPPRWDFLNRLASRLGLGKLTRFNSGSFHQMALNELYEEQFPEGYPENQIVAYETHRELVRALGKGAIDNVVIAVDNTFSGRVTTSIDELRKPENHFLIEKEVTIPVDQHMLFHPQHTEDEIEQVMSQKPALDQVEYQKNRRDWSKMIEAKDTVMSAIKVARTKGVIDGKPTAAIASRLAGEVNNLIVGPKVSKEGNATTFWLINKRSEEISETANRIAFTFSVSDRPGSLLDTVGLITDLGYKFTDIDCHLAAEGDNRVFFAEVEIPESKSATEAHNEIILRSLECREPGKSMRTLGVYEDVTKEGVLSVIHGDSEELPVAINTTNWSREGADHPEGANVVYIDAKSQHGSLKGMLQAFKSNDININDMSRPVSRNGNGNRGFFFVIDPDVNVDAAFGILAANGYNALHYHYVQNELTLVA